MKRPAPSTTWTPFRKSSFSAEGACVEVSFSSGGDARVRDSKHPTGPQLLFTAAEWDAFVAGVHAREFERPVLG